MIKKIFVGVLFIGVVGLLILGAANRTFAKSGKLEPLALSEGSGRSNGTEDGYQNYEPFNRSENRSEQGGNNTGTSPGKNNQNSLNTTALEPNSSTVGNGFGQGNRGETTSGDGLGVGEANVEAWADPITVTVDAVSSEMWVVSNNEGFEREITGRTQSFMVENSFEVEVGDELVLSGFYEGEDFEIGSITNNTTLQTLTIREVTGRPLWAGGGRGSTRLP